MLDLILNRTRTLVTFSIAGCVCLLMAGCGDSGDADTTDTKGGVADGATSAEDECQEQIGNVLEYVEPKSLGIGSKTTSAAIALNDWFNRCGSDAWSDTWGEESLGLFDEKIAGRIKLDRFSESDSLHLRTSLLIRAYAESVEGRSDTERVMAMFYAVVRDVAQNNNELALTPFEIAMTGMGSARDRAWVFVEALRQLRVDGFIISPKGKPEAWLVGVQVDGEVLLFDLRLGLPVFRLADFGDGILPQTAVSLSELKKDDEVLGGLSIEGHDYPTVDADFDDVDVFVVGGPAGFSQRFALLDDEVTAVLCDSLDDGDGNDGLISRVAKAGSWPRESIKVWSYPLQQLDSFSRMTEDDQKQLTKLMNPMQARVERNRVREQLVFGTPHWELFKGRIDQLSLTGGLNIAMRFQKIRLGRMKAVTQMTDDRGKQFDVTAPDEFVEMHNTATEHAMVWVAVHQYQTGEFEDAADSLYEYRRAYPEGAVWQGHAEFILGLTLASNGDLPRALKYMKLSTEVEGPHVAGHRMLHDIWSTRLPADAKEETKEATPAKEEPKADAKTTPDGNDGKAKDEEAPAKDDSPAEPKNDGGEESSKEPKTPAKKDDQKKEEGKKDELAG